MAFAGRKSEQRTERFDQRLRAASNSTLGIQPVFGTLKEQLSRVVIPVLGLDCKACCLGAYEAIYKLPGVAQASVSFREGKIDALIDPQVTTLEVLKEALKKRRVTLKEP